MKSNLMNMEDLAAPTVRIARPECLTACETPAKLDYWKMSRLVAGLEAENGKLRRVNQSLASWLEAELNGECADVAVRDVVTKWFETQRV